MKRKIVVALGIMAAIASLASPVRAQKTAEFTLSGESLKVENLTIEDNYGDFFIRTGNRADFSLNFGNNAQNLFVYADEDDGVWQLGDNWELHVNEPISPPLFPDYFRQDGASLFGNVDRVELRYELLNQR